MSDPNFTIMDSAANSIGQTQVVTRFVALHTPPSVQIWGPTIVWYRSPCTYTGGVVSGGIPSYIYEWDVYGDSASNPVQVDTTLNTSDDFVYQTKTVGDAVTIALTVTDAEAPDGRVGGGGLA